MAVGPVCKRVASNHISDARHFPTALHTELVVGIGFRFGDPRTRNPRTGALNACIGRDRLGACVSENVSIGIRGPLVVLSHALIADNHMRDSTVFVLHEVIAYFDMTISDTYVHLRRKASNASSKYHFDDFHSSHISACGARRGILSSP
jgi:hypothetical protein